MCFIIISSCAMAAINDNVINTQDVHPFRLPLQPFQYSEAAYHTAKDSRWLITNLSLCNYYVHIYCSHATILSDPAIHRYRYSCSHTVGGLCLKVHSKDQRRVTHDIFIMPGCSWWRQYARAFLRSQLVGSSSA